MRRFVSLIAAACLFAAALGFDTASLRAADSPRLVVTVVVDQMRADYLQVFNKHWRNGFRTLLDQGMVFENARYPYLVTVTCAGHATIGTGALPHRHGMINNTWWQRKERALTGCSSDPATTDITYGRPIRLGNSAAHLLAPTLADELRAQKPGARVVSVSMKARSAITLAGRAADAVVWFDDPSGSWATSKAFASGPVPAVKDFVEKNPYEKDLGRVWTLSGPPESYVNRDAGDRRASASRMERPVSASDQRPRRCRRAVLRAVAGNPAGRRLSRQARRIAGRRLQARTARRHRLPRRELLCPRRCRSRIWT